MMKRNILPIILIYIGCTLGLNAQDIGDLLSKIEDFDSDKQMNEYLISQDLVPPDIGGTSEFKVSKIKTDVFKKNLFGDETPEIILQLREKKIYSVNVFYQGDTGIQKVPGQIFQTWPDDLSHSGEKFVFFFEDIFKPSQFCLVTRENYNYIRTSTENIGVYKIDASNIKKLANIGGDYSSYSGLLTYVYSRKANFDFRLQNGEYPKVMTLDVEFRNEDVRWRLDGGGILSGRIEEGTRKELVFFNENSSILEKKDEKTKQTIFLGTFEDVQKIEVQESICQGTTTYLISNLFFENYLGDISTLPTLQKWDGQSNVLYFMCCDLYLHDRTLRTFSKDSLPGGDLNSFQLKPAFSEFLASQFDPDRLYFFPLGSLDGELTYFEKDTIITRKGYRNVFRLGDPALVFDRAFKTREGETIIAVRNSRSHGGIPLKKLTQYLNSQASQRFEECCK